MSDGLVIGPGDRLGVNAAGRPMRIPWDAELGLYEPSPDDPLWWLSFADPDAPAGSQFLGVTVVQAATFAAAVTRAHHLGVNPGGQVVGEPLPPECLGPRWRDRLLTADEIEGITEPGDA